MCGIAGVFHYNDPGRTVDRDLLVAMTRTIRHRGPDYEDFFVEGCVGFGHRRLSIVDLSPAGHQPMANEDRSCWIAYNGEFYNHAGFRRRLLAEGHVFRGASDTETLLHLLESRGPDCLADLAAIFVFGFWDSRNQCLTLARDPLGVKQLYYHDDGKRIVFANEIKALLVRPDVPREPDPEAVNEYLHFHAPLFERTFFSHIRQLRPGEYMQVTRHGVRRRTYWAVDDFRPRGGSPEQNVEELREQLSAIVSEQLMSDVPVGAFFSGGIDSSAVAAWASRSGHKPQCFGVHFTGQEVPDERPYQEAAASALGLQLELCTLDGSTFPDDLMRLIYYQDQPIIGAAMFPMYKVSELAARQVKVCLGGQAGDEVFGGYARYGLTRPSQVIRSWFSSRRGSVPASRDRPRTQVGGNLFLQLADRKNLRRLLRNVGEFGNWEQLYFDNFAKVPVGTWRRVFNQDFVDRQACRRLFAETVSLYPASDPADKAMLWDVQTYLPGLFHQDDRMSMAVSLESRVPLADPRLVRFAFRTGFELKFRGGATKWIMRQAVSTSLPSFVLTRRKVGFDTPIEAWVKKRHPSFIRDLLLSSRARSRGLYNPSALEAVLAGTEAPDWIDVVWKLICVEAWARVFLDGEGLGAALPLRDRDAISVYTPRSDPRALPTYESAGKRPFSHIVREVRELGAAGSLARGWWEIKTRSGLVRLRREGQPHESARLGRPAWQAEGTNREPWRLAFADPAAVAAGMDGRVPQSNLERLLFLASEATKGRILCFGSSLADYGNPIDWLRNPHNGKRWEARSHWSKSMVDLHGTGDIKLIWEVARFPQAYLLARAAAFRPEMAATMADCLFGQIHDFIGRNPVGWGPHWSSGQEVALRMMAWLFGLHVLARFADPPPDFEQRALRSIYEAATHIENNIEYARDSVYNNHLLSEALGLLLAGTVLPEGDRSARWRQMGQEILDEQADKQFYQDGAYIQQSHNYHRFALQVYLWACAFYRWRVGKQPPQSWTGCLDRSLDFLCAQQNPADGLLPNYGANDGSLPAILSTCRFSDFRPILQAASLAARGERIYEPGCWDEPAAWLFGPESLELPLRPRRRTSRSFSSTGYHVLRGQHQGNFAVLRCGTLLDRFSQIDMLHLDVWWRGQNVLVDGGSYLYNGPQKWHDHFIRTASHNTLQIDGRDQMVHHRRFKFLFWTKAKLLRYEQGDGWVLAEGEHYGYQRHPGGCVHRRSVLFAQDDLWVVMDRILGSGSHSVRLHWLCGEFPCSAEEQASRAALDTPAGLFSIALFGETGEALRGTIVAGEEQPPRGWLARHYGEKKAVPSFACERGGPVPITLVSILGAGRPQVLVERGVWSVCSKSSAARFRLEDGSIRLVAPAVAPPLPGWVPDAMNIVVVHQYYLMAGQPGGSRFNEMARIWSQLGHRVTVIAGNVDYATGRSPDKYRYRWITKERDGDVEVWRCHVPRSYNRSYLGRMWAFFGFMLSASTGAFLVGRADIVIATSPPLVVAIPGWIAARWRLRAVPWIFEIRDLWPETAVTTRVLRSGSLLTRVLYRMERWACRRAHLLNVLTPAFSEDLIRRGLAPPEKILFVPNGVDTEVFYPAPANDAVRREFGWASRHVVMYAGAHGRANALAQLIEAADRLRTRPDILIACVGDGPERAKLEAEANRRGLNNIKFHGAQPKDRMPEVINACDVGTAVLANNPTFRTVYPNKVFDYMACAKPVLLAIDGVARRLVCQESGAGVFAVPEDGDDLARRIIALADDPAGRAEMGARGRQWVVEHASREALAKRYLHAMEQLVTAGKSAATAAQPTAASAACGSHRAVAQSNSKQPGP